MGISGHGLRWTHRMMKNSWGNISGCHQPRFPLGYLLTAVSTGLGSTTQSLPQISHETQQHRGHNQLCSPDPAAAVGPAKLTPPQLLQAAEMDVVLNIHQRRGFYWKHPLRGNGHSAACSR